MRTLTCLRCQSKMKFAGDLTIQLGEYQLFFKHLSNIMNGSLDVEMYRCPKCGKIEFFEPEDDK